MVWIIKELKIHKCEENHLEISNSSPISVNVKFSMISIFFFVTYQQKASCDLQADHFSFAVGQKISKTFSRFLIIAQACNTCDGYITHLWYKNANTWYLFATTRHCIIYFIHIMHTIMHPDTNNGRMMSKFQIIFGHNPNSKKYFQKCLKSLV